MHQSGIEAGFHQGLRVTPAAAQPMVLAAAGATRLQLEAALSQGMPNSPMAHARVRVVGGNFVHGRPMGVLDGVDMQHTGCVRSIDETALNRHLDQGDLVLVSCIGHSLTGETFNLRLQDVAQKIATTLRADKLVILGKHWPTTLDNEPLNEIAATELLDAIEQTPEHRHDMLRLAAQTCNLGVERVHLLDWRRDGVLLDELFTRDGVGTMVYRTAYERMRRANAGDVGNLIELLRPMEEQGFLVKRERERLETEIDRFVVVERDRTLIGCAALYPLEDGHAEIACVAVHSDYQGGDLGDNLLHRIEKEARHQGTTQLWVLTTVAAHWFQEKGFEPIEVDALPSARKALYNYQRASKVMTKTL